MGGSIVDERVVAIVSDDEDRHGAASRTTDRALQIFPQFDVLFDAAPVGLRLGLPPALELAYGSDLWLPPECVFSNFVESVDGVVAFPSAAGESGGIISGGAGADTVSI